MTTAYLLQYSRVSSSSQLDGDGLLHQQLPSEVLQELCTEHSLKLYPEIFSDKAVSAFKVNAAERPSFSQLLSLIESTQVDNQSVLVLYNLDRLSRENISTALSTLLRVLDSCRIYISQEKRLFDKDDPNLMVNLMMALISLSRANEESETKRKRSNDAIAHTIQKHLDGVRGKKGGVFWHYAGCYPAWYDLEEGELLPNQTSIDAIRDFIGRIINGESLNQAWLHIRANYPAPKKHKNGWSKMTMSELHKDKALLGQYSLKGQDIPNYYEPIIDEKTYYQFVNARGKRNFVLSDANKDKTSIFSGYGISHCRCCGSAMTIHRTKGYNYLRCASVGRCLPCDNPVTVSEKALLEALNTNLMKTVGLVQDEPTDSNLPMLEANLKAASDAHLKMQQDYMDTQASFLIPMIQSKQTEIDTLMVQIEEEKKRTHTFVPDVPSEIPTDRDKLRKLYRDTLTGLKFWKLGGDDSILKSSKDSNSYVSILDDHDIRPSLSSPHLANLPTKGTLVSVYTVYGISFSMVLWQGRVIWTGQLTESDGFDEENSLKDVIWG